MASLARQLALAMPSLSFQAEVTGGLQCPSGTCMAFSSGPHAYSTSTLTVNISPAHRVTLKRADHFKGL